MNTRKRARKLYYKRVFFISEDRYHKGFINNISLNGAFIETQDQLSLGQTISVFIPGRELGKGTIIHGEIAHLTQKGVGMKFKKNQRGEIIQYL